MRIATLVTAFPVISETFVIDEVCGLIDLGHEVDVYSDSRPYLSGDVQPAVGRHELLERTQYIDMPPEALDEQPVFPLRGQSWPPAASQPISNLARLRKAVPTALRCLTSSPALTAEVLSSGEYGAQARSLAALYRLARLQRARRRYDVIHAQFGTCGYAFRFARRLWHAPMVVTFRGFDFAAWPKRQPKGAYRRLFDEADAFVVNTEFARGEVEALGCTPEKLNKIPIGLDPKVFEFSERRLSPDEPFRLLTVGRLVEKKGIEYAIRAVAILRERFPSIRYDIIGGGPLRRSLSQLASGLRLAETVTFHGARDRDYVRDSMRRAHVFMLTSVTAESGDKESQGLVLQEAQASGLPVVATTHNGFPESIAPGRSGFLVPERDVGALADCLAKVLSRPQDWPAMGRAGRAHVEAHFDIRDVCQALSDLFDQLRAGYQGKAFNGVR